MNVAGIVVEYNPFHNGHLWHAQETRRLCEADAVVGVMSGQFVQRGEAALFDKWTRAQMAVDGGVDLVIELPTACAVRSAQFFASGAIRLLAALGTVTHLCFGAETPDLTALRAAAREADSPAALAALRCAMKQGHSYAKAFGDALSQQAAEEVPQQPNNILAVEYLRAIERFAPQLQPVALQRRESSYHDPQLCGSFSSATAIRRAIRERQSFDEAMPATLLPLLEEQCRVGRGPVLQERFGSLLLAQLRREPASRLKQCLYGSADGLEYRLKEAALQATDWDSLLAGCATKRYTRTRLQRALIWQLLGVEAQLLAAVDEQGPQYARILAFNDAGRRVLKQMRTSSSIPLIDRPATWLKKTAQKYEQQSLFLQMLLLDARASDIYVLAMPDPKQYKGGCDFTQSPLYRRS